MHDNNTDKTILWGVELSPFTLKLQACLDICGVVYKRLPYEGGYLENLGCMARLEYQKQRKLVTRYPTMDPSLDEYPAVPFFSHNGKDFQYDSTAIARYLDAEALNLPKQASRSAQVPKLFPQDPVLNFVAELIDDAFD